jgi:hypothetical protein
VKDAPGIEEVWGLFVDWIAGLPGDGDVVICCWNGKSCDFAWLTVAVLLLLLLLLWYIKP